MSIALMDISWFSKIFG